ncbi:MAG: ABC transporter permease [Saprospiraceae bacterium]|nr:ABC transporter permease [Saprospiraceae bacterium]
MKGFIPAFIAEWLKIRKTSFVWVTFIAFALGPTMGAFILFLMGNVHPGLEGGILMEKARAMSYKVDWNSYLAIISQVVGVGGVLVFGFIASWLFGREYSDRTAKDLLALPVSRNHILLAKFSMYFLWCMTLALSNFLLGLGLGKLIGLGPFVTSYMTLSIYVITSLLVILLGPPIAFLALWGQGYLVPLGFVVMMLVLSQIIGAIGFGHYFPWALPGLYSGSAGTYKEQINLGSYLILTVVSLAGFLAVFIHWNHADQRL